MKNYLLGLLLALSIVVKAQVNLQTNVGVNLGIASGNALLNFGASTSSLPQLYFTAGAQPTGSTGYHYWDGTNLWGYSGSAWNKYLFAGTAASTYFPILGGSITGTAGAGYVGFPTQSATPTTPASNSYLQYSVSGSPTWLFSNGFTATHSIAPSANMTITWPSTSFTIPGLGLANAFTGNNTSSGTLGITNSTASTSSSTGALTVSGGVGIAGSANVAGGITSAASVPLTLNNGTSSAIQVTSGSYLYFQSATGTNTSFYRPSNGHWGFGISSDNGYTYEFNGNTKFDGVVRTATSSTSTPSFNIATAGALPVSGQTNGDIAGDGTNLNLYQSTFGGYNPIYTMLKGSATLVDGTVTVSNANIKSTSIVYPVGSSTTNAGTLVVSITAGTGFTITSTNSSDARTISYVIIW